MNSSSIDLSLIRYQNLIAVSLAETLTLSLLKSIDLDKIEFNINEPILLQISDNECELIIKNDVDIETGENNPLRRYFFIIMNKLNMCTIVYKCSFNQWNMVFFNRIVSKSINYMNFGDMYSRQYKPKEIMMSFSKKMSALLSRKQLKYISEFITILQSNEEILTNKDFRLEFLNDDISGNVTSCRSGLLKFTVFYWNREYSLFFNRSKVGLSRICIEIEKAINLKKK